MIVLRYLKYLVLLALALGLLTVSLANREPVALQLLPDDLAAFLGYNQVVELPKFLMILAGVAVGLLIGFIWEWLREHRHRAEAARARAEATRLETELARDTRRRRGEADEVLALLEKPEGGRRAAQ